MPEANDARDDAISLQEKNYTAGKPLAHFKYWKTKMFRNFQNKAMGFGVETLVLSVQKFFSERISHTGTYRSYGTKSKYKGKKHLWKYLHSTWK